MIVWWRQTKIEEATGFANMWVWPYFYCNEEEGGGFQKEGWWSSSNVGVDEEGREGEKLKAEWEAWGSFQWGTWSEKWGNRALIED